MHAWCSLHHRDELVRHFRLEGVGLRFLCLEGAEALRAVGMNVVEVSTEDPRQETVPFARDRRRPLVRIGQRIRDRFALTRRLAAAR